jgi:hypothetical protein
MGFASTVQPFQDYRKYRKRPYLTAATMPSLPSPIQFFVVNPDKLLLFEAKETIFPLDD